MKTLTNHQIDTLVTLFDEKTLPVDTKKARKQTLNYLYGAGLVELNLYANGYFWVMTTKGVDELNSVRPL